MTHLSIVGWTDIRAVARACADLGASRTNWRLDSLLSMHGACLPDDLPPLEYPIFIHQADIPSIHPHSGHADAGADHSRVTLF